MRPRSSGGAVVVAAFLMLGGCGTADEPSRPSTAVASGSSADPESSTTAARSSDSEGAATTSVDAPTTSVEAPTSSAATTTETPVSAATTTVSSGAAVTAVEPSSEPAVVQPPATFPDPDVVEALGYATNPLCEVLSVDEATSLLGVPVRPAIDDAAGTGCLWNATSDNAGFLQLQMVGDPARYLPPASAETVTGIGDAASVGATEGGWTAQAQNPDGTFAVRVSGATATKDAAVEGLRRLLERY